MTTIPQQYAPGTVNDAGVFPAYIPTTIVPGTSQTGGTLAAAGTIGTAVVCEFPVCGQINQLSIYSQRLIGQIKGMASFQPGTYIFIFPVNISLPHRYNIVLDNINNTVLVGAVNVPFAYIYNTYGLNVTGAGSPTPPGTDITGWLYVLNNQSLLSTNVTPEVCSDYAAIYINNTIPLPSSPIPLKVPIVIPVDSGYHQRLASAIATNMGITPTVF